MPARQPRITEHFQRKSLPKKRRSSAQDRAVTNNTKLTDFFESSVTVTNYRRRFDFYNAQQCLRYLQLLHSTLDAACMLNGLWFIASNNFTEYAVYTLVNRTVITDGEYKAVKAGTQIAEATVDEDSALEHVEVDSDFRKQGIGTSLIRFIKRHDTQFHVYLDRTQNSRYRLTDEGAALITSCQRKNILSEEQAIESTPPPSPCR